MVRSGLLGLVWWVFITGVNAQQPPFSRGVNLTEWFQVSSPGEIHFKKYCKEDFEQIKSLGCDVIRLPIDLHAMSMGAPDHQLDPLFTMFLDQVISWAESVEIYLILDNHSFDPSVNTMPSIETVLVPMWTRMAARYRDRSGFMMYEVLNEPHGISDDLWNDIQKKVIAGIRSEDPDHTIVVGGPGFNSYDNLAAIPDLGDDNLIYTFHFYDPFIFTHQGATWVSPAIDLAGVPFPYDASTMPALPTSLNNTWVGFSHANYPNEGTIERVKALIDVAVAFRDERKVPVYCGEFGVLKSNSDERDRVFYYQVVREYLEANNISWSIWDYHGGFGLFRENGNGLFEHDLNTEMLEALGLVIPPQSEYETKPEIRGFPIYTDAIEAGIFDVGFGGVTNYYASEEPNYGQYNLLWNEVAQYNTLGFDFLPNKDMSQLVSTGFALDLLVKSNDQNLRFDVRFVDTKEDDGDRPWRMRYVIEPDQVTWDGTWQHLFIPLEQFEEHGAWDNAWFSPQGLFDWSLVDRFEVSTEYGSVGSGGLQIDQIVVTDLDTASVRQSTADSHIGQGLDITVSPNPVSDHLVVQTPWDGRVHAELFDMTGQLITVEMLQNQLEIPFSAYSAGVYLLRYVYQGKVQSKKIIKL